MVALPCATVGKPDPHGRPRQRRNLEAHRLCIHLRHRRRERTRRSARVSAKTDHGGGAPSPPPIDPQGSPPPLTPSPPPPRGAHPPQRPRIRKNRSRRWSPFPPADRPTWSPASSVRPSIKNSACLSSSTIGPAQRVRSARRS